MSCKVTGLISEGVVVIFNWLHPSSRNIALVLTQPLTEMSIWGVSWGVKGVGVSI